MEDGSKFGVGFCRNTKCRNSAVGTCFRYRCEALLLRDESVGKFGEDSLSLHLAALHVNKLNAASSTSAIKCVLSNQESRDFP